MKRIISFLFIILFLSGCDKNKAAFQREGSIFNGETLMKTENFDGIILEKEKFLVYKYISQKDSSKTITVKFDKTSERMFFGPDEYQKVVGRKINEQSLSKYDFEFFELVDPSIDGTGPILFNPDYGLLAINNVFGPTIILLKSKEDEEIKMGVLKELHR